MSNGEDLNFILPDAKDERVAELSCSHLAEVAVEATKDQRLTTRPIKSFSKILFKQVTFLGIIGFYVFSSFQDSYY